MAYELHYRDLVSKGLLVFFLVVTGNLKKAQKQRKEQSIPLCTHHPGSKCTSFLLFLVHVPFYCFVHLRRQLFP